MSASDIRVRLAGTPLPRGPDGDFKAAGVLIPIVEREETLFVLLTRRAVHLKYHAGQVCFPGGRMEDEDADIEATALRETFEEVGIRPDEIEIAGYLEPVLTITGYAVTPVVGFIKPTVELRIDPTEVQHAFEVPLAFLLDESNAHESEREVGGVRLPVVEYTFGSERIWGATANIVQILRGKLI